jgi:lambda family phage tail tape measure protein
LADIAEIGFAADTSDLAAAENQLNRLPPAVNNVEKAATSLQRAITTTNSAVGKAAQGMKDLGDKNDDASDKVDKNASSHKGLSTQAMAAQHSIRSMVEQLAMGVPVTQVFSTQLNHLSYAATGPGGLTQAFGDAVKSLTSLVSTATLAALGIAAVAVALALYAKSAISSVMATKDLGDALNLTLQQVKQLQLAASFKGINFDDFQKGMLQFGQNVGEAKENMGTLNGLMIANNMNAKTFMGYLGNVADLVASTSDGFKKMQILQEAGLPVTQQWVKFMSQGSAGIKAAIAATGTFNSSAEENLVKKAQAFDDAWNKATTQFSNYFKSSVLDAISYIDQLGQKTTFVLAGIAALIAGALAPFSLVLTGLVGLVAAALAAKAALMGASQASGERPPTRVIITGGTTEPKPKDTPEPKTLQQLQNENQQAQQRIGLLGELATVSDQVQLKQLQLNAAGLTGVGISKQQQTAVLNLTKAQAENTLVQQQAAIGVFNLNTANKAAADTLQSWIDKKLLDPTNAQQMAAAQAVLAKSIRDTSDAAQVAASTLPQLKQLELDSNNFSKTLDTAAVGAVNNLSSALGDMFSRTVSVGQGFKNMGNVILQALQQVIIKLLIIGPLMKAFSGGFAGLGGGFPFSFGVSASAKGNVFANDNIQRFAKGGAFTNQVVSSPTLFKYANGGAMGEMGEAGPEAIMPLKRGPNGSLGVQMYGGNTGSNGTQITYAPQNVYNIGGTVTQDDIDSLKQSQAEDRKNFTKNVANSQNELARRNFKTRRAGTG